MVEPAVAVWVWRRLAAALPDAFSCVLMPDHLHLMAPPGRVETARRVLGACGPRFGLRFDTNVTAWATTPDILARQIRYGFFNPVRAGLVDDPWAWPWSSLRDLGGACVPVWTPLERVTAVTRRTSAAALRALTHLAPLRPTHPRRQKLETASGEAIRGAVAAALRVPLPDAFASPSSRRLAVQLASRLQRKFSTPDLAEVVGVSTRSVQRLRSPRHPALPAGWLCLGDERLWGGGRF